MEKNWRDGPRITTNLFDHIVQARKLESLSSWLEPRWPDDLHDPFALPDMNTAAERIWQAVQGHESVGIVGDYDMDGTPATALLVDFFRYTDTPVYPILPTREEGYGFSPRFVDRLKDEGVTLIITVDCGIRDNATVAYAREKGIDVIITDHHECGSELPQAVAVINPKRADSMYPFRELCGTGVAFKLVQALLAVAPPTAPQFPDAWLAWSLDLVALATISDMVPLRDENRLLVTYGLRVLKKTKRQGLLMLCQSLDIDIAALDYQDLAFKIIPKLNASGRMSTMEDVLTILLMQPIHDPTTAVQQILVRNTQSQMLLQTMLDEAKIKAVEEADAPLIMLSGESWHPGLTGLVASRLVEVYQRPVGIFATIDDTSYRGSFRGIPGVDLPALLESARPMLQAFGGHAEAAGLSFSRENYIPLKQALTSSVIEVKDVPHKVTDGTIEVHHTRLEEIEALERLAPWGMGHSEPIWSISGVMLEDIKWLKEGKHLKAVIKQGGHTLSVIYFGAEKAREFIGQPVDLCGTLSINVFRNNREPQFMIRGLGSAKGHA